MIKWFKNLFKKQDYCLGYSNPPRLPPNNYVEIDRELFKEQLFNKKDHKLLQKVSKQYERKLKKKKSRKKK